MSAIAGFFMPYEVFAKDNSFCRDTIHKMSEALIKRGPDHQEYHLFAHGAFCHNALFSGSIHPQIPCKTQPVTKRLCNNIYTLFYDGYVTNLMELKKSWKKKEKIRPIFHRRSFFFSPSKPMARNSSNSWTVHLPLWYMMKPKI